jgi:hypothetical protein
MKKKTHTPQQAEAASVHREATADFAERQRLADEEAVLELRQGPEHAPTDERLTGDADTNWDAATDSSEAFPGYVPTVDVDEVDALGMAAGLTYADDEPLNYNKVAERDENRWELDPASALDRPRPDEDEVEDEEDLDEDEDEEDDDLLDDEDADDEG